MFWKIAIHSFTEVCYAAAHLRVNIMAHILYSPNETKYNQLL